MIFPTIPQEIIKMLRCLLDVFMYRNVLSDIRKWLPFFSACNQ